MKPKFNKVFVLAPANYTTGGVELAHQLVDLINKEGGKAYIIYIKNGNIEKNLPVTSAYSLYNIQVANEIEDSDKNILLLPEIYFDFIYGFERINFGLWWMSVDNHYNAANWRDLIHAPGEHLKKILYFKSYIKKRSNNRYKDMKGMESRIVHFYQSAYAQNHLYNLGFSRVLPLKDYINTDFLSQNSNIDAERKDIVLYNPSKGGIFTKKIISANPDIQFIPLNNLTREQLRDLMQSAKLYIDFGSFPGKDRLPREAVLNGLCVITGKRGASRFFEDISIDEEYKFDNKVSKIPEISKRIREIFLDYPSHISKFEMFRDRTLREYEEFRQQILSSFFIEHTC